MAEKERSFGNWVGNVVTSPGKMLHTGGNFFRDGVNTVTGFLEDLSSSTKTMANQIADCFSFDKKWYQKILNIPVAAGIGLVGTVKALLAEPLLNTGSRAGKTVLNATTNTFKSTLGSRFSARPVSDISFNTLKTKKKGVIKIDTSKFILDPNKSWVPNRGTWSKHKKRTVATTAAVGTAAAAGAAAATGVSATTAADIRTKEISYMKKDFETKMEDMKNYFQKELKKATSETDRLKDQLDKLNEAKSKLKKENDDLKKSLAALQKEKQAKKEEKPAETKPAEAKTEAKPVETKDEAKVEEKPTEVKPVETKDEAKSAETKPTETKTEAKSEKKEEEVKTEEKKKTDKE